MLKQKGPGTSILALPYLACMLATAAYYHLPPRVLPSIQAVEGGYPGAVHVNTDGTADLGLMQINTRWVHALAAYKHLPDPQARTWLVVDPCTSIATAGAILDAYRTEEHGNLLQAIGDYHSHTPPLNQSYRAAVMNRAMALFGGK